MKFSFLKQQLFCASKVAGAFDAADCQMFVDPKPEEHSQLGTLVG
jgi:hypothetical protein